MSGDLLYLRHILDAIEKIESYTAGEATKNLSTGLRDRYQEIPWRRISGLRDVLIHEYMGVDLAAVWEITQVNIPPLRNQIQRILEELDRI